MSVGVEASVGVTARASRVGPAVSAVADNYATSVAALAVAVARLWSAHFILDTCPIFIVVSGVTATHSGFALGDTLGLVGSAAGVGYAGIGCTTTEAIRMITGVFVADVAALSIPAISAVTDDYAAIVLA